MRSSEAELGFARGSTGQMEQNIGVDLAVIGLVIYATSLHELAHAYVATRCGDPTPGREGRLTWNPIPHLTPLFTAVVIPVVFFLTNGSLFILAQTPINPSKFRKPLRDHALVAAAGPAMNFLIAGILLLVMRIPGVYGFSADTGEKNGTTLVIPLATLWIVILGFFNLLPLPPLDGYWIVRGLLPIEVRQQTDALARSPMSLLVVLFIGSAIFGYIAGPIIHFYEHLLPPMRGW